MFKWKKKITFEKTGSVEPWCEVTIELPARHDNMIDTNDDNDDTKEIKISINEYNTSSVNIDAQNMGQKTLLTEHMLENSDETIVDHERDERDACEKVGEEVKVCEIPVIYEHKRDDDKVLPFQSFQPHKNNFLQCSLQDALRYLIISSIKIELQVHPAFRDQISDFEKEYNDVSEIVKKENIKRSISVFMQNVDVNTQEKNKK